MNIGLRDEEISELLRVFKGDFHQVFAHVVAEKNNELLKKLLLSPAFKIKFNDPSLRKTIIDTFLLASEKQDTQLVKLILQSPMLDIIRNVKELRIPILEAFCDAAEFNDVELLKIMIKSQLGIDYRDECALKIAVVNRNYDAVKVLLQAGSVLPGTTIFARAVPTREMLLTAVANGDAKTINLLLTDRSIDPAFDHNILLKTALESGFNEVLHFLLQDDRINPGEENNIALCIAARNGNLEGVKQLLQHPKVGFPFESRTSIRRSEETNPLICAMKAPVQMREILVTLLKDPRSDPNSAIDYAIKHDLFDAIELLLNDPRLDLTKMPQEYRSLGKNLRSQVPWDLRRVWKLTNEKLTLAIPERHSRSEKILLTLQELKKLGYLDTKTSKLLDHDQFASAVYTPVNKVKQILRDRGLPNQLVNVDEIVLALLIAYFQGPNKANTLKILETVLPTADYQYLQRYY
ncbi:Hypothetical protein POVR1_LOCUS239 [uncultured virus]|nr:Hypothetical protein POVR1_LOCUS239 [uncultured virus]